MGKQVNQSDKTFDAKLERLRVSFLKAKASIEDETGFSLKDVGEFIKTNKESLKSLTIYGLVAIIALMTVSFSAYNNGYRDRAISETQSSYASK